MDVMNNNEKDDTDDNNIQKETPAPASESTKAGGGDDHDVIMISKLSSILRRADSGGGDEKKVNGIIDETTTDIDTADTARVNVWIVVISYAIFFHDVVYDAKSSTNEKDSAKVFRKFASGQKFDCWCEGVGDGSGPPNTSLSPVIVEMVVTFIHATEKHQLLKPPPPPLTTTTTTFDSPVTTATATASATLIDAVPEEGTKERLEEGSTTWDVALSLFLDLDMSVLGKSQQAYMSYAGLIRKEYSFVPRTTYCEKRAEILQSFLTTTTNTTTNTTTTTDEKNHDDDDDDKQKIQKPIYLSKIFQDAFEDRARQNLTNEIELLQKGTIPSCE